MICTPVDGETVTTVDSIKLQELWTTSLYDNGEMF